MQPAGLLGPLFLIAALLYTPRDEMAMRTIADVLAHHGFANPARPLEMAEGEVIVQSARHSLNTSLAGFPRDGPVAEDSAIPMLAAAVTAAIAGLRAFTPGLTLQGYERRRAEFYKDVLHVVMRNTQIRGRMEPHVMRAHVMDEVERIFTPE